jgi:hypothetical protein
MGGHSAAHVQKNSDDGARHNNSIHEPQPAARPINYQAAGWQEPVKADRRATAGENKHNTPRPPPPLPLMASIHSRLSSIEATRLVASQPASPE